MPVMPGATAGSRVGLTASSERTRVSMAAAASGVALFPRSELAQRRMSAPLRSSTDMDSTSAGPVAETRVDDREGPRAWRGVERAAPGDPRDARETDARDADIDASEDIAGASAVRAVDRRVRAS